MKRITLAVIAIAALAGCSSPTTPTETVEPVETTPTEVSESPEAIWPTLPIGDGAALQATIDEYQAAGDCENLQATFNQWADAEAFADQADVLIYIDGALESAGCY